MPFDAFPSEPKADAAGRFVSIARLIDEARDPEPHWAQSNPDRMLAFLFVAPRDCAAVDQLLAN
ncbi:MAG: hypothetical protein K1X35_13525 [Caulobacteraceae bacterium]|nr:hypothetical protein [Caulobacteraceae bacterium]